MQKKEKSVWHGPPDHCQWYQKLLKICEPAFFMKSRRPWHMLMFINTHYSPIASPSRFHFPQERREGEEKKKCSCFLSLRSGERVGRRTERRRCGERRSAKLVKCSRCFADTVN